jgi:hypothetical protein
MQFITMNVTEHEGCITAVTCTSEFHLPEEGR